MPLGLKQEEHELETGSQLWGWWPWVSLSITRGPHPYEWKMKWTNHRLWKGLGRGAGTLDPLQVWGWGPPRKTIHFCYFQTNKPPRPRSPGRPRPLVFPELCRTGPLCSNPHNLSSLVPLVHTQFCSHVPRWVGKAGTDPSSSISSWVASTDRLSCYISEAERAALAHILVLAFQNIVNKQQWSCYWWWWCWWQTPWAEWQRNQHPAPSSNPGMIFIQLPRWPDLIQACHLLGDKSKTLLESPTEYMVPLLLQIPPWSKVIRHSQELCFDSYLVSIPLGIIPKSWEVIHPGP